MRKILVRQALVAAAASAQLAVPRGAEIETVTNLPDPDKPKNLPGETNRQFAARVKREQAA